MYATASTLSSFLKIVFGAKSDATQMLVVGNADHPFGGNSSSEQCLRQPGAGLSCGKLTIAEEETQMVRQTDCHLT